MVSGPDRRRLYGLAPRARPAGRCAAAARSSGAWRPGRHAGADAAPLRAAGPAHRRPDRRRRHLCRLLRLRRPAARHRRPLALRLRAAEPGLGRGALRLRLAAAPARRRHGARPGQRPLPRRRVHLDEERRPRARPRDAGRGAAADLVHEPVAAASSKGPTTPSTSASCRPSGARCAISSGTCAPHALPGPAPDGGDRPVLCGPVLRGPRRPAAARDPASRARARPPDPPRRRPCEPQSAGPDRAAVRSPAPAPDVRQPRPSTPPEALLARRSTACCRCCGCFRHGGRHPRRISTAWASPPPTTSRRCSPTTTCAASRSGTRRIPATSGSRPGARSWSPMSAAPPPTDLSAEARAELPLLRVLERRASASSSIAALPRSGERGRRAGGPLDRGPFDRGDRRRLVGRFLARAGLLARALARALAPAPARTGRAQRARRGRRRARRARRRPRSSTRAMTATARASA